MSEQVTQGPAKTSSPKDRLFSRSYGNLPLLHESDLPKYAQLPPSQPTWRASPRGGVDTAISLDTKDITYLAYFTHIRQKIDLAWRYPPEGIEQRLEGQSLLLFVLRDNGQLVRVELIRSSGSKILDKEAWDAIVSASPFGPFPAQVVQDELHIRARFTYLLDGVQPQVRVR